MATDAPLLAWAEAPPAPAIDGSELHLWRIHAPSGDDDATRGWTVLGASERRRALAFRDAHVAAAFIHTRAGLRGILSRYVACDPASLPLDEGADGRPLLRGGDGPGLAFSTSRSGASGLVALAARGKLGVDIERVPGPDAGDDLPWSLVREHAPGALLRDVPPGQEDDETFCVAWTRLEAYAKACSGGLAGLAAQQPVDDPDCLVRSFRVSADLIGSVVAEGRGARVLHAFDAPSPARS
ncbi:MAG TPA: hypothetical protein VGF46_04320 [Gaiellales bacterium]|jgi:4'-phosphopantetheinyl transferase